MDGAPRPLDGRVALVTGGSRGIGRAIALRLARDGAIVAVNHPGEGELAREVVVQAQSVGPDAMEFSADVSVASQVQGMVAAIVDRWRRLDILVNNAGICPFEDWFSMTEALWQRVHDVNVKGVFLCSQAASRIMREQGTGGRIISLSSISALVGGARQTHYAPTKAAVRSLMQSLAIVLGPYGITCNSVLPGSILTDINRAHYADAIVRQRDEARIPLGRLGTPQDVAGVVAFLAGDDARYINGADILVDGGWFVNLQ